MPSPDDRQSSTNDAAEPPTSRLTASRRRAERASEWTTRTDTTVARHPLSLVVDPDGDVFVRERGRHRAVTSGLLASALEAMFGPPAAVSADERSEWVLGPPVVVLEGPVDGPFLVLGGRRHRVLGLPLPHPVGQRFVDAFAAGDPIDVFRLSRQPKTAETPEVAETPQTAEIREIPVPGPRRSTRSLVGRIARFTRSVWWTYRRFGVAGLTAELEDRIEQAGVRRVQQP